MESNGIPILMYHSIQSEKRNSSLRGLSVPPLLFKIQLYTLKILGYKGLNLTQLLPYLEGKRSGKVVGITFDDGYQNNVSNALPILSRLGFSATCFIVSGNIGGFNHWDISKGVSEKRMMSEHDIRRWIDSGMEIGSHSQNHIKLSKYDQTTIENEILGSKRILADKFNTSIDHFCYPYGDKSDKVEEVVKTSGYKTACSVVRGKTYLNSNLLSLPRVLVNHRTFPLLFAIKILSKYEDGR